MSPPVLPRVVLRGWVAALVGLAVACGLAGSAAHAATAPPHFDDGFGLTVISQLAWMDAEERTFTVTVRSDQVPAYPVLPGQVSGEHVIMVTLPTGYDGDDATRYPVHYTLHGAPEYPDAPRNKAITERATEGVALITVTPNGGGRGWYTNWVNPGALDPQNWEAFHLDQLIPLIAIPSGCAQPTVTATYADGVPKPAGREVAGPDRPPALRCR